MDTYGRISQLMDGYGWEEAVQEELRGKLRELESLSASLRQKPRIRKEEVEEVFLDEDNPYSVLYSLHQQEMFLYVDKFDAENRCKILDTALADLHIPQQTKTELEGAGLATLITFFAFSKRVLHNISGIPGKEIGDGTIDEVRRFICGLLSMPMEAFAQLDAYSHREDMYAG